MRHRCSPIPSATMLVIAFASIKPIAHARDTVELATSSNQSASITRADDGAGCAGTIITQNTDPDVITTGTVACAMTGGGPTVENYFARSYSITSDITIACVDFAIESNIGGDWPVRVRLYNDTNGGVPTTLSLVQLGPTVVIDVPDSTGKQFFTATFPGGVEVPAGTTLVVELFQACRATASSATCPPGGDGGRLFLGSNNLGQSAPTYIKAPGCGIADYVSLAAVGFPNVHIIQVLGTDSTADNCDVDLPPCHTDIAGPNNSAPDGLTNTIDLLKVIETWGENGQPKGPRPQGDCAPLPQGDCLVNVQDLLAVVNGWGACPQPTGACCLPSGQCVVNQTLAQCQSAGGTYLGHGSTCPGPCEGPANDNCFGAITLGNGSHAIDNTGATNSTGIPGGDCIFGGPGNISKDIWFKYTATCNGNVTVDLCATTGIVTDTTLQIYSGTCASLVEVRCDDDGCTGNPAGDRSRAIFSATQGTQYIIRVGVWGNNAPGPMVLTIQCTSPDPPPCHAASPVGALPATINGSLLGAYIEQAPTCNNVEMSKSRWYTVVGNGSTLTASLCNSPIESWDSRLSVYCGPSCSTLFCVVAADDTCGTHSQVSWCSNAGQTYYIVVHTPDNVADPEGNFVLNVTSAAACNNPLPCGLINDFCAGAIDITSNIDGDIVIGNNSAATPTGGNDPELPSGSPSCHWSGTPTAVHNTLWYTFIAPNVEGITVETCPSTSPFTDSIIAIYAGTCGSLTQIACGEDECSGDAWYSQATAFNLAPGQTYFVMVANTGAWSGSITGEFKLKIYVYQSCRWSCPPDSLLEGEPCLTDGTIDVTNGGCNSTPTVYNTNLTANGPAVCGTSSTRVNGAASARDTDWYHFVPETTGTYRIRINAEFTAIVGFVQGVGTIGGPCGAASFVSGSIASTAGDCDEVTSPAATLAAGVNYAVFAAPTSFVGWPCANGQNDYWVQLLSP